MLPIRHIIAADKRKVKKMRRSEELRRCGQAESQKDAEKRSQKDAEKIEMKS